LKTITHRDEIHRDARYDHRRYYVPVNQSLFRVTADAWLAHLPIAEVAREKGTVNLFFSAPGATPRFTKAAAPAMLAAVRLRPSAEDLASYFLISAELGADPETSTSDGASKRAAEVR
jgi:hypothetical protein